MLALLADQAAAAGPLSVALAAPTGKAAARLQEAVRRPSSTGRSAGRATASGSAGSTAMTLHRLLGWRPDNATRFRHDRGNRLKYDVVVVDESSMVELTMMARLLEAVRPQSRLVLVGDPRQLTSVGAGAVLSDLVAGLRRRPGLAGRVAHRRTTAPTETSRRSPRRCASATPTPCSTRCARDVRRGRVRRDRRRRASAAAAPTRSPPARARATAALPGTPRRALGALDQHRLLCAHREGPYGVRHWNRQVERWLAEETGQPRSTAQWYVGRPLLVTSNDYALDLYNGETGVAVRQGRRPAAGVDRRARSGSRDFAPGRLDAVETMHAMTIHKSQGSQAERVTVLLPEEGSRLLTRELFYTAVTRAQDHVRVVGSEAAVRAAVGDPRAARDRAPAAAAPTRA